MNYEPKTVMLMNCEPYSHHGGRKVSWGKLLVLLAAMAFAKDGNNDPKTQNKCHYIA